jgi:hypothetical protein
MSSLAERLNPYHLQRPSASIFATLIILYLSPLPYISFLTISLPQCTPLPVPTEYTVV